MVPIHDTDIAEERWSKTEWEGYELWEKVELREIRKRRFWILSTILMFLVLSAIPICIERLPNWVARSLTRQLAQEVNHLKMEASVARMPYRLKFTDSAGLNYTVEKISDCRFPKGEIVRTRSLNSLSFVNSFTWFTPSHGAEMGVPGLVDQFCYDPLLGSDIAMRGKKMEGLAVIPVKDLSEKRLDRMSILLLTGPSAEISFE